MRPTVERNYGGYYYNTTIQAGMDRLDQVRKEVSERVGKDVQVILKRGCTEYERKYGDSSKWDSLVTPEWKAIEEINTELFKLVKMATFMPEYVRKNVMTQWILFAADRGDPSIPSLHNGKKIFPGYVTYERPTTEEVPNGK